MNQYTCNGKWQIMLFFTINKIEVPFPTLHLIFALQRYLFNYNRNTANANIAQYAKCHNFLRTDINECESNPCKNGATCNNNINSYSCTCVAGYIGTNCEEGIHTSKIINSHWRQWMAHRILELLSSLPSSIWIWRGWSLL